MVTRRLVRFRRGTFLKDVLWEEGRERRFMVLGEFFSCWICSFMSMCQSSCGFCIYRRREYGSGYPSGYSGSVSDEGFPYYFWPVIFPLPCKPKYKPIYPKTQYVVRSLVSASSSTQRTRTNYTFRPSCPFTIVRQASHFPSRRSSDSNIPPTTSILLVYSPVHQP